MLLENVLVMADGFTCKALFLWTIIARVDQLRAHIRNMTIRLLLEENLAALDKFREL